MGLTRKPVLIAHCDGWTRTALCALVDGRRYEALSCSSSVQGIRARLASEPVEVLLLDLRLLREWPREDQTLRDTRIIVVSEHADDAALDAAMQHGCAGYLVWPCGGAQLSASLALAFGRREGQASYSGRSGTHAIGGVAEAGELGQPLSAREQEVCDYLRAGHRVSDVASRLFISPHTVRKHAQAVFRKLGVHSQVELMRHYSPPRQRRRTPT